MLGKGSTWNCLNVYDAGVSRVSPTPSVARAERLHLAHPHDEGAVLRAGLRGLEEAHALGDEGCELEGRAVEVVARLKRRHRAPTAAAVRRVQLDTARGHVVVAVE